MITDASSPLRYARSAYFVPARTNSNFVYIGGPDVSDALYTDALKGADGDNLSWVGDWTNIDPANRVNYVDLYNTWVDADDNGAELMVTITEL